MDLLPRLIVKQPQEEPDEVESHVDRDGDKGTLCDQPLWGDRDCEDDVDTDNGHGSVGTGTRLPLPATTAAATSSHTCGDTWSSRERHPPAAVGRRERAVAANSRPSRPRPTKRVMREDHSLGSDGCLYSERTMPNRVRHCRGLVIENSPLLGV